ncbi:MAG: 50S ribosomal protein L11 methyltransferase [Candidatus Poribacteria bacterium]|nr:50S ribosomal protein L11 methyltransferase [Candidatus Poribacteria bacterium]
MHWAQITVTTSFEASEAVSNFLIELDARGVEQKDTTDASTSLIAYYPLDDLINTRIEKLRNFLSKLPKWGIQAHSSKIDLQRIESEEWTEAWKSEILPQSVGKNLRILPTWHEISPDDTSIHIRIDPGMAFGTGYHPTTRLSLEMLEQTIRLNQQVADIGTGSGILAIAAVKLGAESVDAVELDESAIPVAEHNFKLNEVAENITLIQGDGIKSLNDKYDIIVGNILTKAILPMIPHCPARLNPNGHIIFSGILENELGVLQEELAENGLECDRITRQAEDEVLWIALRAKHAKS